MALKYVVLILSVVIAINCDPLVLRDCGPENRIVKLHSITMTPYPIIYPGSVKVAADVDFTQDISGNIKMKLVVDKLTPTRMFIPCIGDMGSCTYNFCDHAMKNFGAIFASFGINCPITRGRYSSSGNDIPLPNFGSAFDKIFVGSFEGNATWYDEKTNQIYGCVHLQFTVTGKQ